MPNVTVACKLPHGLTLRVFRMEDFAEPVMGGGTRTVKKAILAAEPVTLNRAAAPQGESHEHRVIGGYALTPGIDADFWGTWLEQNKDSDIVRNRLVFALEKEASVESKAREHKDTTSGLERLDVRSVPSKDGGEPAMADKRIPRVALGGSITISPGSRSAA